MSSASPTSTSGGSALSPAASNSRDGSPASPSASFPSAAQQAESPAAMSGSNTQQSAHPSSLTVAQGKNMDPADILRFYGHKDAADSLAGAFPPSGKSTLDVVVPDYVASEDEDEEMDGGENDGTDQKSKKSRDKDRPQLKQERRASQRIATAAAKATKKPNAPPTPKGTISTATLISKNAPKVSTSSKTSSTSPVATTAPTGSSEHQAAVALASLQTGEQPAKQQQQPSGAPGPSPVAAIAELIHTLEGTGAEEALAIYPNDKFDGFKELEEWVSGSLDMYAPEFRPILFPVFCYFYLDLVQQGFKKLAVDFHAQYAPALASTFPSPAHSYILHHLSTLLLPSHIAASTLATRFRSEKYNLRMSKSGFGLLLGWLTDGNLGAGGIWVDGGRVGRGRAAVMRVVNDHLEFEVTSASTTAVPPSSWTESTGLLASLIPSSASDPKSFNVSQGPLKLGPAPIPDALKEETERALRDDDADDNKMAGVDSTSTTQTASGLVSPSAADLPPQSLSFRPMDVKREADKVREARKRIRLDPSVLTPEEDLNGFGGMSMGLNLRERERSLLATALPSVCAYTFHDSQDGLNCSAFSPDSSLLAAGFSESYIRLWNLKKDKLRGLRSDFNVASVKDSFSFRKIREKTGSTTRKLIGHSAPIFALSFDPLSGTSSPPRYLLSASADATTRLWSLETMTNLVAYRGHENPIWDVEWSPLGNYFVTGSRDRTARLWSTERIKALRVFAGHLSDVDCVKFHPNSLYLATGSSDQTCRLWDVQRGACVRVFIGHQGAITSLATSPDGRYLASAATDLSINLWDLASGNRVKTMTGHNALINSLSFSSCSSLLVSGSSDWTVRCWDVKSAGGLKKSSPGSGGSGFGFADQQAKKEEEGDEGGKDESVDLVATFHTKRTPILNAQFTPRNLCMVSGVFIPPPSSGVQPPSTRSIIPSTHPPIAPSSSIVPT